MNFLTLGQLREDLAALDALPACLPTNVTALLHERGEIIAEGDDSAEEELRKELEDANDMVEANNKEAKDATVRAVDAEVEAEALREEMARLKDPSDEGQTVASYRDRAKVAEQRAEQYQGFMVNARQSVEEAQRELKALRARKGTAPGVCRHSHEIMILLRRLKGADSQAALLLAKIEPKEDRAFT